jgi:hypothetical protein
MMFVMPVFLAEGSLSLLPPPVPENIAAAVLLGKAIDATALTNAIAPP